jgi:phosphonate transport system substrate-binding protein
MSEPYFDIPVMAHPDMPPKLAAAVREAFVGMGQNPEGRKALQASAEALGAKDLWSFVPAEDKDYENYRRFYRTTVVKGD